MFKSGELTGFRLGKLIRIPAVEVERFECQNTPSGFTDESTSSGTEIQSGDGFASRLGRQIGASPKRGQAKSGQPDTPRSAKG
jgi:hypothetical protein